MVQVLSTLNERVSLLSGGLPAALSWLKVMKGKMFSKFNRNNRRKSLKNSKLGQCELHVSRLSRSYRRKPFILVSVITMGITHSFSVRSMPESRSVPTWLRAKVPRYLIGVSQKPDQSM